LRDADLLLDFDAFDAICCVLMPDARGKRDYPDVARAARLMRLRLIC